jgi:predicted DNA-binding transcriptional regulator AlpA
MVMLNTQLRGAQEGEQLITSRQVAEKLNLSVRSLWRMVAANRFPAPIRYNRKLVRWRLRVVDKWIQEQQ